MKDRHPLFIRFIELVKAIAGDGTGSPVAGNLRAHIFERLAAFRKSSRSHSNLLDDSFFQACLIMVEDDVIWPDILSLCQGFAVEEGLGEWPSLQEEKLQERFLHILAEV